MPPPPPSRVLLPVFGDAVPRGITAAKSPGWVWELGGRIDADEAKRWKARHFAAFAEAILCRPAPFSRA